MNTEKRLKKGKLIAVIAIIVIILVIIIINIIIKNIKSKNPGESENPEEEEVSQVIELPDTTYSDMQVTNVNMEFLEENNETMVTFIINNGTENVVQQESLNAILLDSSDQVLGEMPTYIEQLGPGEQYSISVVLKGDLTATSQIRLEKQQ